MDDDDYLIPMRPDRSQYHTTHADAACMRLSVAQGIVRWIERRPDRDEWRDEVAKRWLIGQPGEPDSMSWYRTYVDLWEAMQAARWLAGQQLDMTLWGAALPLVREYFWSGEWPHEEMIDGKNLPGVWLG